MATLRTAMRGLNLSARVYVRTIKVARTIANMDGQSTIKAKQITEAIHYRPTG